LAQYACRSRISRREKLFKPFLTHIIHEILMECLNYFLSPILPLNCPLGHINHLWLIVGCSIKIAQYFTSPFVDKYIGFSSVDLIPINNGRPQELDGRTDS